MFRNGHIRRLLGIAYIVSFTVKTNKLLMVLRRAVLESNGSLLLRDNLTAIT